MAVMELHQERTTTRPGKTMKAIVHERYGMPDVLELRDIDVPVIADDQVLLRVHAASLNPAEWYGVTGPFFVRLFGGGPAQAEEHEGRRRRRGRRRGRRQGRDGVPARRRGVRHGSRRLGRVRTCPRGSPRAEAGQRVVRGSGSRPDRGDHRPPGAARQGGRPARTEGADQRRLRRRRHLRRPDREGARRGRDRRVQHEERRPRPLARGRPRRRLQPGGLHAAQRAPRADDRHRREPAVQEVQARADTRGDSRRGRGEVPVERGHRAAVARARNAPGRAWAGARRSSSSSRRSTRTTSSSCASCWRPGRSSRSSTDASS